MTVRVEKKGKVWTVIHSRAEARNAMDPQSADALVQAFTAFNDDPEAAVAVLWGEGGAFCSGFDLKHAASLSGDTRPLEDLAYPLDDRPPPRGSDGADPARARQTGDRRDRGPRGGRRLRAGAVVRLCG